MFCLGSANKKPHGDQAPVSHPAVQLPQRVAHRVAQTENAPQGAFISLMISGANMRIRTADLLITNQLVGSIIT